MGDLQCAARLFLARAAEGDEELTSQGEEQARKLAESVVGQRIAHIWTSPLPRAMQTAEVAAARLGVKVVVRQDLGDGGPAAHEVGERVCGVLGEAADLYRGESVLVVSHRTVIDRVVPLLALNLGAGHSLGTIPPGGVVELDADADGWTVRSWAGEPLA